MKEQDLKEMSLEKLEKTGGMLKGITYVLGFVLLLLLVISLYVIIGQGKTSMISLAIVPFALMPLVLMNGKKIKQLNQEISNRK